MYSVLYFTLEKKNISDWPKSGPVETGPTGPVATPLKPLLPEYVPIMLFCCFTEQMNNNITAVSNKNFKKKPWQLRLLYLNAKYVDGIGPNHAKWRSLKRNIVPGRAYKTH